MSIRAVSVKVNGNNPARIGDITYDNTINVKVDNQQDYLVKSANYGIKKLSQLDDVYSFNPIEGNMLIFNAATGKYVSKQIDLSEINVNIDKIDGGLF